MCAERSRELFIEHPQSRTEHGYAGRKLLASIRGDEGWKIGVGTDAKISARICQIWRCVWYYSKYQPPNGWFAFIRGELVVSPVHVQNPVTFHECGLVPAFVCLLSDVQNDSAPTTVMQFRHKG